MLRRPLLAAARSTRCRQLIEHAPFASALIERFVAGQNLAEALPAISALAQDRLVTLDHLGEDVTDAETAEDTVQAYTQLLAELDRTGLAERVEVSVKLSALGQALPQDGERIALANARRICAAAQDAGTTVTLDMEDHTTTDSTLDIHAKLRADYPWVGAVVQSYLRRTEQDCRDLAAAGARVRLCKGAYDEPASVAYRNQQDVDRSYVRCARVLMQGSAYPMIATHDPRLIGITQALAVESGRGLEDFEFQMLYGVRDTEQRRLAAAGNRMRVYVPYGQEWYGYYMRRIAERPANLAFFLRSLVTRG
ncbi:proline dehydrogenase family protein [Lipingzhangella sp. LS1_29]|uniref:proline dehydrogenase n=1 Tax=Lipingzhangella rawalii TaxID=2055835 RepID=A0ABU2HA59_9ACTN|nr:proline dehydrogenase family protein [Lipingzhangella rawalii]MDS1272161.1 proline dehydrogenase family protein [Lipingzhangella rawalii]